MRCPSHQCTAYESMPAPLPEPKDSLTLREHNLSNPVKVIHKGKSLLFNPLLLYSLRIHACSSTWAQRITNSERAQPFKVIHKGIDLFFLTLSYCTLYESMPSPLPEPKDSLTLREHNLSNPVKVIHKGRSLLFNPLSLYSLRIDACSSTWAQRLTNSERA